ncbi:HAMP domain-containing histidine kinase [Mucilaginibacter daejeonensis]|uniref:sensor histidine kinase n=1 Tax=Mucilaginibacter daejeonensis TaxID=398049 RepID=UPI001D1790E7|nr:HAMP domain-containing sensor histidine kinase [Mucilaginibacter daejeonensis]UEG55152.1 HAMP domain-containing histidine kinase [Mucilaginibacter daejeonensis]
MIFKRYEWQLLLRILLLFGFMCAAAYGLVSNNNLYIFLPLPFIIYLIFNLLYQYTKIQQEVQEFAEAAQYRDFSRHYAIKNAPSNVQVLRQGFNEINVTFKTINRERETQYHYLQNILELVGTGILSYEQETGEVGWINESFKNLISIPYLRNISSLEKRAPELYEEIIKLRSGNSRVVTIQHEQQKLKILLMASLLRSEDKLYKLVAFQNVSDAMDESESNAWSKLLNVMTHEIMNSVAPISSLANTLKNRLKRSDIANSATGHDLEDLELGIDTIKRRSEGLLKFTESYRSLNKITKLELQHTLVYELFENLNTLMLPTLEKKNIELDVILRDLNLAIDVDVNLLEQVLINLLVNAIEAVKDRPEPTISLSAEVQGNKTLIKVSDNGLGMSAELLEKIFIPFFSTRKTGSGIGLSLCKQIMLMHKGNITVQSTEGKGTVFTLQF